MKKCLSGAKKCSIVNSLMDWTRPCFDLGDKVIWSRMGKPPIVDLRWKTIRKEIQDFDKLSHFEDLI